MITEKMIEAHARADAEFAERDFDGMSAADKARFRERSKVCLQAALAAGEPPKFELTEDQKRLLAKLADEDASYDLYTVRAVPQAVGVKANSDVTVGSLCQLHEKLLRMLQNRQGFHTIHASDISDMASLVLDVATEVEGLREALSRLVATYDGMEDGDGEPSE